MTCRRAIFGLSILMSGLRGGPATIWLRMIVVVAVVRAVLGIGEHGGNGRPAAAGAAGALLIVLPLRRDIPQADGDQRADVDANLHGRRATEHVDRPVAGINLNIPEPKLELLGRGMHTRVVAVG